MYTIEKTFTGDLAHRIHNQNLDSNFTEGNSKVLKCRRLHGHTFSLKVKLGSEELVDDMVLDYNEIGFVKNMINDILDHRTLLSKNDPWYEKIIQIAPEYWNETYGPLPLVNTEWDCEQVDISNIEDQDIKEFLSSFTLVPFTTSSENIAKWIYGIVEKRVDTYNKRNNTNVKVLSVSYKETPNSEAIYLG